MARKVKLTLDEYVIGFCNRSGISSKADIFVDSDLAKEGFSLTIKKLLEIAIRQNFGPVLTFIREEKERERQEFADFRRCYDVKIRSILDSTLSNYIEQSKTPIKYKLFITDFLVSSDIHTRFVSHIYQHSHIYYIGGPGMGKNILGRLSHDCSSRSDNELFFLDCSDLQEDEIIAKLLGYENKKSEGIPPKGVGLIEKAHGGSLFLYGLKYAGEEFKSFLSGLYGANAISWSEDDVRKVDIRIICAIPYEDEGKYPRDIYYEDSMDHKAKSDIAANIIGYAFPLVELKHVPQNIPLIIYLHSEKLRKNRDFPAHIVFPHILIHYWLKYKKWLRNYEELICEIESYTLKFMDLYKQNSLSSNYLNKPSSEVSKKIFLDCIKLIDSEEFESYLTFSELKPYELIDHSQVALTPYMVFMTRYFDSKKNRWLFKADKQTKQDVNYYYRRIIQRLQFDSDEERNISKDLCKVEYPAENGKRISPGRGKWAFSIINTSDIPDDAETVFPEENLDEDANNKLLKPSIPQGAIDSIIPFTLPPGIEWKQLAVGFADDSCMFDIDDVRKTHPTEIRTFEEMGFQNQKSKRNSIRPYKEVLGKLADNHGKLRYKETDATLIENIAITNKRLQYFFRIKENLIECDREMGYYYSMFKIYRRSDS